MKRSRAAWSLLLTLVLGATAFGVPALGAPKAAKSVPLDEITVYHDTGSGGGENGGSGETWILRSNDTAEYAQTFSTFDHLQGAVDTDTTGRLEAGTFAQTMAYLRWTRLLNLKVPNGAGGNQSLTVSLVRRGKEKSITIPDDVPASSAASAASWTTLTLVQAMTSRLARKAASQFKAGPGA